jgi:hypothetical protein
MISLRINPRQLINLDESLSFLRTEIRMFATGWRNGRNGER